MNSASFYPWWEGESVSCLGAKKLLLVPDRASLSLDYRFIPKESLTPSDSDICRALLRSVREATGKDPPLRMLPGFFDISYFIRKGIPSLMYGPGALEVVHQENEHISLNEVIRTVQILALTAIRFLD